MNRQNSAYGAGGGASAGAPFEQPRQRTVLGHPPGLFLLFLVEMWERFSYYGMRGLLVLYLITVFAAHQLPTGTYHNTLKFSESVVGAERTEVPRGGATRDVVLAINGAEPGDTSNAASWRREGASALIVERLSPPAQEDGDWSSATADDSLVIRGDAQKNFDHKEFRFRITNPSSETIKLEVEVEPDPAQHHTYFTVNDSPSGVVAQIKPDAERESEKPFELSIKINDHDSGRNWTRPAASTLYGWYTGLAYLFPILGGILADKLIGTHRSMLIGGILISLGHVILGVSGYGAMAYNETGMALFVVGLAVIVLGTGHFKPTVSVMVGQLYGPDDPRRDGAFTIFYMGINLGAFICAFVCGTLGQKVGWHWGFASAAVGMLLGLGIYMAGRPALLSGIGEPPAHMLGKASMVAFGLLIANAVVGGLVGVLYHLGAAEQLVSMIDKLQANPALGWTVLLVMLAALLAWVMWFLMINAPQDRGPVVTIFVFMLFNAFFWIAFEQAGSSLNVFTEVNTERRLGGFEVPATWFQSVNAGLIFLLAPLFAWIWTRLGRVNMNPSQPVKIALGLIFLGIGYVFMVWAGRLTVGGAAKASMFFILMTYLWHTIGELCLSPTGLSYVTRAAPVRFVSLLMGIWFISSFIANLGGGLVAAEVEAIERGELRMPWQDWGLEFGGQADFFAIFVVFSIGPGLLILLFSPLLKKLMRPGT